jgi:hypothetical protein
MRMRMVGLLVFAALVLGFTAGAQTGHNEPSKLSDVRAGMTREVVESGLNERYTVKKMDAAMWGVYSKNSDEEGTIAFEGDKVAGVYQNVVWKTGDEAVSLFKGIYEQLYFKALRVPATGNQAEALMNRREIPALIDIDELHLGKVNFQRITMQLGNSNVQIEFDEPSTVMVSKAWQ